MKQTRKKYDPTIKAKVAIEAIRERETRKRALTVAGCRSNARSEDTPIWPSVASAAVHRV